MTEVFQPLNDRAAETITKNADLLEGSSMEPLLLQLVAHVFAYRVIIKRYVHNRHICIRVVRSRLQASKVTVSDTH